MLFASDTHRPIVADLCLDFLHVCFSLVARVLLFCLFYPYEILY